MKQLIKASRYFRVRGPNVSPGPRHSRKRLSDSSRGKEITQDKTAQRPVGSSKFLMQRPREWVLVQASPQSFGTAFYPHCCCVVSILLCCASNMRLSSVLPSFALIALSFIYLEASMALRHGRSTLRLAACLSNLPDGRYLIVPNRNPLDLDPCFNELCYTMTV